MLIRYFQDPCNGREGIFMFTSDHQLRQLIFRTAEKLIGSGYALFNRIRKFDTESVIAQSHGIEEQLTFTDNEMQEKIHAVCQNELHVDSPHQLGRKDLLRLARTLAYRFSASKKQISRLLGIAPDVLDNAL